MDFRLIMKTITLTIVLFTVISASAQTDEKSALASLNQNVTSAYKEGRLNDALKFAQQALEACLKVYGDRNIETATAYTNLGVIQRDKSKIKEAVVNLRNATVIYEALGRWKELITAYETLAFTQFMGDSKAQSEASYLKAIETAETKLGKESKHEFSPTLNLANIYARDKKFEKADEYYLKSYELAIKNFGKNSQEQTEIDDSRVCLIAPQDYDREKQKAFRDARKRLLKEDLDSTEIMNGKALALPKPRYPVQARSQRLGGTIAVRVRIDETGNVVSAKAICGPPILREVSEESARGAKFNPTLKDGKAIPIDGVITYRFVP